MSNNKNSSISQQNQPVELDVELVGVLARAVDVHTVVVMGVACNGNVVVIIIKFFNDFYLVTILGNFPHT